MSDQNQGAGRHFTYDQLPGRVVFGAGRVADLPAEVERLGCGRALVVCTPEQRDTAEAVAASLGAVAAGVHDGAVMHTPVETVERARGVAAELQADCYVAVGGGTTIGLGKGIALETGRPVIAVPTTYSGSEMTPIIGLTENGVKRTLRDMKVLPRTVIYDPDLTASLPAAIAGPSGMNAIAHSVEALYAENANPVSSLMAEEGIRALAAALPRVVADPGDAAARAEAFYGSWLCGAVLGCVGMALHHKLCHTLGGSFNLPHAETHTVVLPHAASYNAAAAPEALARVARALGLAQASEAGGGLFDLAAAVGAPTTLSAIGMKEDGLDRAADLAVQNPYYNPAPVTRDGIRALLDDAFHGRRPTH